MPSVKKGPISRALIEARTHGNNGEGSLAGDNLFTFDLGSHPPRFKSESAFVLAKLGTTRRREKKGTEANARVAHVIAEKPNVDCSSRSAWLAISASWVEACASSVVPGLVSPLLPGSPGSDEWRRAFLATLASAVCLLNGRGGGRGGRLLLRGTMGDCAFGRLGH